MMYTLCRHHTNHLTQNHASASAEMACVLRLQQAAPGLTHVYSYAYAYATTLRSSHSLLPKEPKQPHGFWPLIKKAGTHPMMRGEPLSLCHTHPPLLKWTERGLLLPTTKNRPPFCRRSNMRKKQKETRQIVKLGFSNLIGSFKKKDEEKSKSISRYFWLSAAGFGWLNYRFLRGNDKGRIWAHSSTQTLLPFFFFFFF